MRSKLIVALLLLTNYGLTQENEDRWRARIVDDLTVYLPGEVEKRDTSVVTKDQTIKATVITCRDESAAYTIYKSTGSKTSIKTKEDWRTYFEGLEDGFVNKRKETGYECTVTDTIIDGLMAKKILSVDTSGLQYSANDFLFLVNSKAYTLNITPTTGDENEDQKLINRFVSGIHFNHENIKELPESEMDVIDSGFDIVNYVYIAGAVFGLFMVIYSMIKAKQKKKANENKHTV
jgi:hypothetical protein